MTFSPRGYCAFEKVADRDILMARRVTHEDGSPGIKGFCSVCFNIITASGELPQDYGEIGTTLGAGFPVIFMPQRRDAHTKPWPDEKFQKISRYVLEKDWARALKAIEHDFDKNKEMDWYNKGQALNNLGRHKEALKSYSKAVEIDPYYAKAWYRKGWVHLGLKEFKHAYNSFSLCISAEDQKRAAGRKIDDSWKTAAGFSATITLIYERNPSAHDPIQLMKLFMWVFPVLCDKGIITEESMPFESLKNGKFPDFLVENQNLVLGKLEPQIAPLQAWVGSAGLPGHH